MSLLIPDADVPFDITRLGHVVLTSVDLDRTRLFYETGLGLQVTGHTPERLHLRGNEETAHHSLVFEKAPANDPARCRRIGYRMYTDDDLEHAHEHFARAGGSPRFVEREHQGRTLQLNDGVGVPLEFCATMSQSPSRLQDFHAQAGGKPGYLDHVQVACPDVDAAYRWYNAAGFRLTEYTARDGTDELWGVWLKRKNNPQDVVFSNGAGPRLHHFAYHVPEVGDVIHAADVLASLGLADSMDRAPGRHGIGNAFFIYFRDPDGHRIELFTSHYTFIDSDQQPRRWDLSDTRRSQLWGFPAPAKWFREASEFEGVAVQEPLMNAQPVTLEDYLKGW